MQQNSNVQLESVRERLKNYCQQHERNNHPSGIVMQTLHDGPSNTQNGKSNGTETSLEGKSAWTAGRTRTRATDSGRSVWWRRRFRGISRTEGFNLKLFRSRIHLKKENVRTFLTREIKRDTHICVVQRVSENDRPSSASRLVSLILGDGDWALIIILNGDDSNRSCENLGVLVINPEEKNWI